jgi:sugar (pentulose or hexulose) kinase
MVYGNIIGLDAGTTGCKAAIIDADGTFLSSAFREYPVITGPDGKAEQDAMLVLSCCKEVVKEAVRESGINCIDAISLSVQGDAIVPVDKKDDPVYACILGMDYRSSYLCDELREKADISAIYKKTGMPLHPINSAMKIQWLKKHADLSKAERFMTYSDFLTAHFTGLRLIDFTMASRTMLYDLKTGDWDPILLEFFSVPRDMLSDIVNSGQVIGYLKKDLCTELGLENTPVLVSGAHDQPCCALGAGIDREGMAVNSMGTAEAVSTIFSSPRLSDELEQGSFSCYRHADPRFYFTFTLNHTAGIILRWFRDTLCGLEIQQANESNKDFYEFIQQDMPAGPSSVLMLPHFNGRGTPHANATSKGMFAGLTLSTTKQDILKGIMDSLCYELLMNIEYLSENGISVDTLRCVGGGSRSDVWLQSKADILNKRVDIPGNSESGCLGAGILAAAGAGLHSSLEDAQRKMTSVKASFYPRAEMHDIYKERYKAFLKMYDFSDEIDLPEQKVLR